MHIRFFPTTLRYTLGKMNQAAAVIPHEHFDLVILIRQVVYQCFFDVKLDSQHPETHIFPIVDRCADPTDRPFHPSSSPDDGHSIKNRHNAAPLGNKGSEKRIET